jgi:hypothetical protein
VSTDTSKETKTYTQIAQPLQNDNCFHGFALKMNPKHWKSQALILCMTAGDTIWTKVLQ